MVFGIEQKKGAADTLDGRLTVYARIDIEPSEILSAKQPIASMVRNGFLTAQGNFRDQYNLRDFLKSEMGLSLEEGLNEFMERFGGFESGFDSERFKGRLQNFEEFEDMIPTPAKIVEFNSREEILAQEGDVFCLGTFRNINNATLGINAFPIMYQARFREQEILKVRSEIDQLVGHIERNEPIVTGKKKSSVPVEERILKEFIPKMFYSRDNPAILDVIEKQLREHCARQDVSADIDAIAAIIRMPGKLSGIHFRLLELYARKIAETFNRNAAEVEKLGGMIRELKDQL